VGGPETSQLRSVSTRLTRSSTHAARGLCGSRSRRSTQNELSDAVEAFKTASKAGTQQQVHADWAGQGERRSRGVKDALERGVGGLLPRQRHQIVQQPCRMEHTMGERELR
jgi:hypothetical protein